MLQIAICDDEPSQLALLEAFVSEWAKENRQEISLELCRNAEQFLFLMEERAEKRQSVDILLLDIEMPGMDGVALAHRLREEGAGMLLLFVTGIAERAAEGYDVDAVSFLIKPVKKERTVVSSYSRAVEIGRSPVLIGERINPTGKKRFKQALREYSGNRSGGAASRGRKQGLL